MASRIVGNNTIFTVRRYRQLLWGVNGSLETPISLFVPVLLCIPPTPIMIAKGSDHLPTPKGWLRLSWNQQFSNQPVCQTNTILDWLADLKSPFVGQLIVTINIWPENLTYIMTSLVELGFYFLKWICQEWQRIGKSHWTRGR